MCRILDTIDVAFIRASGIDDEAAPWSRNGVMGLTAKNSFLTQITKSLVNFT